MKNKKIFLLILIMIFCVSIGTVNAAQIRQTIIKVDGKNVYKVYDNDAEGGTCPRVPTTNKNCVGKSSTESLEVIDGSNTFVAFCVDFGNPLGITSTNDGGTANASIETDLVTFFAESGSSMTQQKAEKIVQKLRYLAYFGYLV